MRLFCLKGCSREAALGSGTICDGTRGSRITITIADRHGAQIQSIYVIHVFHRQLRGAASGRADGLSGSVRKSGAAHRERIIGDLRARCVVTKDVVLVAAVADTGNSYLASRRRITSRMTGAQINCFCYLRNDFSRPGGIRDSRMPSGQQELRGGILFLINARVANAKKNDVVR